MELSITFEYLQKNRAGAPDRSVAEAARIAREAGFRYVDYTPDFKCENYIEQAYADREALEKEGLQVVQSHAPFNRYGVYPSQEIFYPLLHRSFEVTKIIGAKHIVVHADEYRTVDHYDVEEITQFAYDYLAPEVDYAKKNGFSMAIENLFEDHAKTCVDIDGCSRFCSRVNEQISIIDRFGDPETVYGCWDFGHAACSFGYENMLGELKKLGSRLRSTHVHDNSKQRDLHMMPFLGNIDWESHMQYMGESGYPGALSLEFVYGSFSDEVLPTWLRMAYSVGQNLISMYNKARG